MLPFRDPPPKAPRKTRSKAVKDQSDVAQAKKPASRRTRKPAEILDDPIGDFESDDDAPVPSIVPHIAPARSIIMVPDNDSVIEIDDSPQPEPLGPQIQSEGEVWEACYKALIQCRENVSDCFFKI